MLKRLFLIGVAAFLFAVPGTAAAMNEDPGGGGGSGTHCVYGIMSGEGMYAGYIPYSYNSITQLTTTIRNMNVLGFNGSVKIWTSSESQSVSYDLHLFPGVSTPTIVGPSYTTGWYSNLVPYHIYLSADSDAVGLSYKVCA